MTEYLLVLALLLVALAGGVFVLVKYPDWANKTLLVALAGALIAGISWAVKQAISVVNIRAQLLVYELLSKHQPKGLTRQAIEQTMKHESSVFRFIPGLTLDALAYLVNQKQVAVSNALYTVPDQQEQKESMHAVRLPPSLRGEKEVHPVLKRE